MGKKRFQIKPWIINIIGTLGGIFFVMAVVYGATTIGNNINTGGNLDVDGTASTTNATTTGYLYVGADITEPSGWDFGIGDLIVTDDAFINSQATTSASLWVGSGGTANNLDLASGDLFVQGDAEFDGVFYFNRATGTSATTTQYLYVGPDGAEPAGWNFSLGDLFVTDDAFINSQATTSASLWVGSGGTANNIDLASGDLFVQGDAEFDGTFFFQRATGTSATTTDYLYVGPDGAEPAGWNFSLGDLFVTDDVFINSQATTSASLWVGSGGTADNINLTGGDLYVQDAFEADGDGFVNGGTFALATGTATTTAGLFVGPTAGTSTTTVGIGTETQNGCIELGKNGAYYRVYINENGTALVIQAGRCKD